MKSLPTVKQMLRTETVSPNIDPRLKTRVFFFFPPPCPCPLGLTHKRLLPVDKSADEKRPDPDSAAPPLDSDES